MKVLYVSKALVAAAYRDKIRELQRFVRIDAVVPARWGTDPVEKSPAGLPEPRRVNVLFGGHNHFHLYPGARDWIDAAAPDLVHVDEEPYSLVTYQLATVCRRRRTPFVFFAWQNLDRRLPPPFGRVRAAVFRQAAGALAGTRSAEVALRTAGYTGPLAVVPQFGVDPDRFRPDVEARQTARRRHGVPATAFVVGYGGRVVAEKGVQGLLDAFARLDAKDPEPHFLIVGDGPELRRLRERARSIGVADRIHCTGRVPSAEMADVLPAVDLLVLPTTGTPTWTEQFGRILVEAMACGVAVAGSRCGEIPSVIADAGTLFDPGDTTAIATVLEQHQRDPGLCRTRGEAGRKQVAARFTQRIVAERTADFYGTLLERARVAV